MRILYVLTITLFMAQACTLKVSTKPTSPASRTAAKTAPKSNPNGKVPPGQMKKTTGSQSAKPYAPGQQNKKK